LYLYFSTSIATRACIEPYLPASPDVPDDFHVRDSYDLDDSSSCLFRYLQLDGSGQVQELQHKKKIKNSFRSVTTE
jgi:hypothetical protein